MGPNTSAGGSPSYVILSRGCRVARQPIRDIKRAAAALNPRGLPCERISAPPATAHGVHSAATADKDFLPQLSITGLLKRLSIEAACRRSQRWCDLFARGRYLRQQPGNAPEIAEGSTLPDRGVGIMTMSEYEERFRSPRPSLHQSFAEARGPNRGRRRSRPFWVAAALVGVMSMTMNVMSHHTVHSGASNRVQLCESGIR
jgi:hypothetical protein